MTPLRLPPALVLLLALIPLLAPGAAALAHGTGPQQQVDGYLVTLVVPQKGWYTGANPVEVILWDAAGMPVDAAVSIAPLAYAAAEEGHGAPHSESADVHSDAAAPTDAHADGDTAHDDSQAAEASAHDDAEAAHTEATAHADDHSTDGQGLIPVAVPLVAGEEADVYAGELAFDKPGSWTVGVVFIVDGQEHGATFELAVAQSRPRVLVLGGFALVNGLVIVTAAVLRRRAPRKPARSAARPASVSAASTEEQPR